MAKGTTLDLDHLISPDELAAQIVNSWTEWHNYRSGWLEEKKELRNYVFATDTSTTTNAKLPWSNSTTTPELCRIYDSLKAQYEAALFPNSNWMRWESDSQEGATRAKREAIQGYMDNKIRTSDFERTASLLVDDYVLYGNAFATVKHVAEYRETADGEFVAQYVGPKAVRISPYDIVFNPAASSFAVSPKIVRTIVTLGDARKMFDNEELFGKMLHNRRTVTGYQGEPEKANAYTADGFSSIQNYYGSSFVELLTFFGDIYDPAADEFMENQEIVIVDRAYIAKMGPNASWLGNTPIYHAGWRNRPDNLFAMGPLDNLVGLQYRIDHLENLKADVFDQIALPVLKMRGNVEDFAYEPGARVAMDEDSDVQPLVPDATALNADFQIRELIARMEEAAGSPRQSAGIRTPGEKTAFEVQTLESNASRLFQNKAAKFEREFLEPLLNAMLESGRRNMTGEDLARVQDLDLGVTVFQEITKEDITAAGKIVPKGARHFAERAQRVQHITSMMQAKADPSVGAHLSGKKQAEILAHELGEPELYGENIAIQEQAETQRAAMDTEADQMEEMMIAQEQGL